MKGACSRDAEARAGGSLSQPASAYGDCVHWIEFEINGGLPIPVGAITLGFYEHHASQTGLTEGVAAMAVQYRSTLQQTWKNAAVYEPAITHDVDIEMTPAQPMVAVRVVFFAQREGTGHVGSMTAVLYECSVWDKHGPHGPLPAPQTQSPSIFPNPIPTLRQLLGVNGIWGWGTGAYSDLSERHKRNERATQMSSAFSHARNYHNWHWDVADPDTRPKFHRMAQVFAR